MEMMLCEIHLYWLHKTLWSGNIVLAVIGRKRCADAGRLRTSAAPPSCRYCKRVTKTCADTEAIETCTTGY